MQKVTGTISSREDFGTYSILTLKTQQGDLVFLRYTSGAVGFAPQIGEIYEIAYRNVDNTYEVLEVARPYQQQTWPSGEGPGITGEKRTVQKRVSKDYDVRPAGVSLIVVIHILSGFLLSIMSLIILLFPYTALFGFLLIGISIALFFVAYGTWHYRAWARVANIIVGAIFCLTIIGAILGIPIILYMMQDTVNRRFVN